MSLCQQMRDFTNIQSGFLKERSLGGLESGGELSLCKVFWLTRCSMEINFFEAGLPQQSLSQSLALKKMTTIGGLCYSNPKVLGVIRIFLLRG